MLRSWSLVTDFKRCSKSVGTFVTAVFLVATLCTWRQPLGIDAFSYIGDVVSGKVIMIDPGHGMVDRGVTGRQGSDESTVSMDIAMRLQQLFNRALVYTEMTRQVSDGPPRTPAVEPRQSAYYRDIISRVGRINEVEPDLVISIHAGGSPQPTLSGAQAFYGAGSEESRRLAVAIQDCLVADLGSNARKAKPADFDVVVRSSAPAALVEVGYLTNSREETLLSTENYRQLVAKSIYRGVVNYLVESYTREPGPTEDKAVVSPAEAQPSSPSSVDIGSVLPGQSPSVPAGEADFTVYFIGASNFQDCLVPEIRRLPVSSLEGSDLACRLIELLIAGPGERSISLPVLPIDARVNQVRITDGTAYIDMSSEWIGGYWGGSRSEELTVGAIVNTLTGLEGVSAVQISVDGSPKASIGSHICLDRLFRRDASLLGQ